MTNFYLELLGIKTEEFEPNINQDNSNDCVIRAICKLTSKGWDFVYQKLTYLGAEYGKMPNSIYLVEILLKEFGFSKFKHDKRNYTIGEFMYKNKEGSFLIGNKEHCVAYINGIWYDNNFNLRNPDGFLTKGIEFVFANSKICV